MRFIKEHLLHGTTKVKREQSNGGRCQVHETQALMRFYMSKVLDSGTLKPQEGVPLCLLWITQKVMVTIIKNLLESPSKSDPMSEKNDIIVSMLTEDSEEFSHWSQLRSWAGEESQFLRALGAALGAVSRKAPLCVPRAEILSCWDGTGVSAHQPASNLSSPLHPSAWTAVQQIQ